MKIARIQTLVLGAALAGTALVGCSDDDDTESDENIAEVATNAGNFTTLVGALQQTGLDATLSDENAEFTVFAPTDAAFGGLGDLLDTLSDDELANILTYHVVSGRFDAAAVAGETSLTSVQGAEIPITVAEDGSITVGPMNAAVSMADIEASNGIIHQIEGVMVPPVGDADPTFAEILQGDDFSTLLAAVQAAGLVETLTNEENEYTVFAPTNAAFDAAIEALETTADDLLARDDLDQIILYHVVPGTVLSTDLMNGDVTTAQGSNVTINIDNGVTVNGANVTTPDVAAVNGVVHVIDAVLLPPAE